MRNRFLVILAAGIVLSLGMRFGIPEEGMYPLSELKQLDLVEAGLEIDPSEIYNPNGLSLVDALVNVGGCTGSFVSGDGLIITNHHCAFRSISRVSSAENNYLEEGFLADNREDEIPAQGVTCRITESYEDVSEVILSSVEGVTDVTERIRLINQKISELEEEATDEENSITADVA